MSDGTASPGPESVAADPAAGTDAADAVPAVTVFDTRPRQESPPARLAHINHPVALGFFITLGGLFAFVLGVAVSNLSTIIIYIVFALFAALGLDPVVRWFERHKVKRPWAIVIVYAAFAIVMVAILWLIVPAVVTQIAQFIGSIPDMVDDFESSDLYAWLQANVGDQIGTILSEVEGFLTTPANIAAIGGGILRIGVGVATTISGLIIVLVLSLYFLASLPVMKESFNRFAPARNRAKVASMTEQITDSIGGYLMGMVILAFCNSVVAFILHLVLGLPFPALMAVLAFAITLIPLIGSVLYWVIATTIALFTGPVPALIFAAVYLVYMQIEAYLLTPRVMNKTISVPGALVVIGALVGGTLLGLLGALVAIPVTASILLIIKQVLIPRQDAKE